MHAATLVCNSRPGLDPFGGTDRRYSCDSIHKMSRSCAGRFEPSGTGFVITDRPGHSRLLGGHGDDTISASPWGDVIWGDYKPTGNTTRQSDRLSGGAGPDCTILEDLSKEPRPCRCDAPTSR